MSEIELSICVPTLNMFGDQVRELSESLRSTLAGNHTYELIIVDNSSNPQGVSAPSNAALKAARGDYLASVNDDVTFLPGWWPPLKQALDAGAWCVFPHTIGGDGFFRQDISGWVLAMTRETYPLCCATPGELYDLDLKIWYQDDDLRRRLENQGHAPFPVMESKISHGHSRTVNRPDVHGWASEQIGRDGHRYAAKWATT